MDRVKKLSEHLSMNVTAGAAATPGSVVKYEVLPGRVALITLNNPASGNAFSSKMQVEYMDALDRANSAEDVGAIVVTGAGKMFCVGADKNDLNQIQSSDASTKAKLTALPRDVAQIHALEIDKPIIAAINGPCAGIGFVAACMADVRFCSASKDVKLTTAFTKRGLIAEHGISYVLPRIVGQARALDLLLSARVVLPDEALSMGLVNRLSPDAETCVKDAVAYAREMVKFCSPVAMAEIRRQIYDGWGRTPREEFNKADKLMLKSFKHPDFKEGVASLIEKREPKYPGFKAGFIRDIQ